MAIAKKTSDAAERKMIKAITSLLTAYEKRFNRCLKDIARTKDEAVRQKWYDRVLKTAEKTGQLVETLETQMAGLKKPAAAKKTAKKASKTVAPADEE